MSFLLLAFFACCFCVVYPPVIYPILAFLLARVRPRPWREAPVEDAVVHVITVFNEETRIEAKLRNALDLNPPDGGLRTVVVDDGSTDGTRQVVERFLSQGVEWIGCPRRGKEQAQIEAIRKTREPIVVFSDASTTMEPQSLQQLVRPLADPEVGAVSGTDRLGDGGEGTGESIYVRYEMALRRAESLAGSLVGLSGCFFAARRSIAERLLPDVPSDLGAALLAIRERRRAVIQADAFCTYTATPNPGREFARKRRTALRGLRGLWAYRGSLKSGGALAAWQIVSHKWWRFAVPIFMLAAGAVAAAAAVDGQTWGLVVTVAGIGGLGMSALVLAVPALSRSRGLRALGFATLSASAVLAAWFALARGKTETTWRPTERPEAQR